MINRKILEDLRPKSAKLRADLLKNAELLEETKELLVMINKHLRDFNPCNIDYTYKLKYANQ